MERRISLPGRIHERGFAAAFSALISLADFCWGALRGLADGLVVLEPDALVLGDALGGLDDLPGVKPLKVEDVRDVKCGGWNILEKRTRSCKG